MATKNNETTTKQIKLTLPNPIFKKLENEKKKYAYLSVQEIIVEALRDKYFKSLFGGVKRGRPNKLREEKILTRKKIFSKKGVAVQT